MESVERAVATLKDKLGPDVLGMEVFRGQTTVVVHRDAIMMACKILHDDPALDFDLLAALTAVDYWPEEPRFAVVYQLYSLSKNVFLGLRVPLQGDSPELPTVEAVYPNANWHEREIYDMFGITFGGHSDLRRILLPHDWQGHPLRKDHPLGYEEVQFSFNFDEIERRKRYAKE